MSFDPPVDLASSIGHLDDETLVLAARSGRPGAVGGLFLHCFDGCYDVALGVVHSQDAAAEVARETFLAVLRGAGEPRRFGAQVLCAARERALARLDGERFRAFSVLNETVRDTPSAMLAGVAAQQHLVWTAAGALGQRDASLLDLHLRHGLEYGEIAQELGVTSSNAEQELTRLRAAMSDAIAAALLWRDGSPACPTLAALIPQERVLDADAVRVIRLHQSDCAACTRELVRESDPVRLMIALPLATAPAQLRDRALMSCVSPTGGSLDAKAGPLPAHVGEHEARPQRRLSPVLVGGLVLLLVGGVGAVVLSGAFQSDRMVAARPVSEPISAAPSTSAPEAIVPTSDAASELPTATTATSIKTSKSRTPTRATTTSSSARSTSASSTPVRTTKTTTAKTSSISSTTTKLPPPVVSLAATSRTSGAPVCSVSQHAWTITWKISGASSATVNLPSGVVQVAAPSGSTNLCLAIGSKITLTATGPGGTTTAGVGTP